MGFRVCVCSSSKARGFTSVKGGSGQAPASYNGVPSSRTLDPIDRHPRHPHQVLLPAARLLLGGDIIVIGKSWETFLRKDLDWECEKASEDGARGTLRGAVALSPSGGEEGHVRDEDDEAPDPEHGGSRGGTRGGDEDTECPAASPGPGSREAGEGESHRFGRAQGQDEGGDGEVG